MKRKTLFQILLAGALTTPAAAQFSSDFPGVPRAAISVRGGTQARTEWIIRAYKIPSSDGSRDTIAVGTQLGFGRSYRIQNSFEISWDFTLLEGLYVRAPGGPDNDSSTTFIRGLAGYGIRLGAKFRPISALDPDGYGYEVSVGGGFQPEIKPLFGVESAQDTTRTGGQFSGDDDAPPSSVFRQNPFAKLHTSTMLAAMGSYRSRRLHADAAIFVDNVGDRGPTEDPSPLGVFDGTSVRAGASYRVTPRIALGASYWGDGSPPWRDEVTIRQPGAAKEEKFGFLVQFGGEPESGVDLVVTTPTGKLNESARLYFRFRSTR